MRFERASGGSHRRIDRGNFTRRTASARKRGGAAWLLLVMCLAGACSRGGRQQVCRMTWFPPFPPGGIAEECSGRGGAFAVVIPPLCTTVQVCLAMAGLAAVEGTQWPSFRCLMRVARGSGGSAPALLRASLYVSPLSSSPKRQTDEDLALVWPQVCSGGSIGVVATPILSPSSCLVLQLRAQKVLSRGQW